MLNHIEKLEVNHIIHSLIFVALFIRSINQLL